MPFSHARPDNGAEDDDNAGQEEEEDNFIVEDDSIQAIELPAEFSMNTYQDLLHHFKIVCQLFVHMAVHDEDERGEAATKLQKSTLLQLHVLVSQLTGNTSPVLRDATTDCS